jgi:hypothetical protein
LITIYRFRRWNRKITNFNNVDTYLLTYLCGTTTNIWLRPVQEDLSMTACLEHSAFNLWTLGPGCRCSLRPPTWISVFLEFSFHWVWLWIEFFVVGLIRVFWSCDQRSTICLSSWHLGQSGCQTLYRVRGFTFSCRHQLVFLPFGQHPRLTAVEQDCADQGLVNGEFCLTWKVSWLQMFTHLKKHLFAVWILRCISWLTLFVGVIRDPK